MPRRKRTATEPSSDGQQPENAIILEDGEHHDDPAEREVMERGQAASEARNDPKEKPTEREVKADVLGDRNAAIIEKRKEGVPLNTIAKEFGLSSTRIWRILNAAGVTAPAGPKETKEAQAKKGAAKKK